MPSKNILLVQLQTSPDWAPFACETLAGTIKEHCADCSTDICFINPKIKSTFQKYIDIISKNEYDIIGFSVPQTTRSTLQKALNQIKIIPNNPLIVLGGALPTNLPESFLEAYPDAIISYGWGEEALVSLVNETRNGHIELKNIPNIIFQENGKIFKTVRKEGIDPSAPSRLPHVTNFASIESSRGCHYGCCSFCVRPPEQKKWRRLDISKTIKNILEIKGQGISSFTFVDEDFIGPDLDSALQLAQELEKIGSISFSFSTRVDSIYNQKDIPEIIEKRENLLKTLTRAGMKKVFIGAESLSDTQLKRYGKGISVDTTIKAVSFLKQCHVELELGFILFDPLLTMNELNENLQNLKKTGMWQYNSVFLNEMRLHEGTPYAQKLKKEGLLREFDPEYGSYEWVCKDLQTERVRQACKRFSKQIKPLYRLIRNLDRTGQYSSLAACYGNKLKQINLCLLESFIEQANTSKTALLIPVKIKKDLFIMLKNLSEKIKTIQGNSAGKTIQILSQELKHLQQMKSLFNHKKEK